MEGAPPEFDTDALVADIKGCAKDGDNIRINEFHLWSISQGKLALSAHVHTSNPHQVLKDVTTMAQNKYNIGFCTIQIEDANTSAEHKFESEQTTNKKFNLAV